MKYIYRIPLIALFLFVMTSIVVNHHTTYGQIPTLPPLPPTLQPLPTGLPTLLPQPSGFPTLPSGTPLPQPSGFPTLPSGTPLPQPSGFPTLPSGTPLPQPSGFPTLPPLPGGSGAIFGFINDENDDALQGVTVTLDGADSSDSVITDVDGTFQFNKLAAGEYTLTCEKDGYQTYTQESIILSDGEVKVLDTIVLEVVVKAMISGYVVDIDGDPIENVKIKAKGIKTGYNSTISSDADGFFEFKDLEADTYIIIAKKKGYKRAKQTLKLDDGEETEIEVEMKKTSKRIIKAAAR